MIFADILLIFSGIFGDYLWKVCGLKFLVEIDIFLQIYHWFNVYNVANKNIFMFLFYCMRFYFS